MPNIAPQAAIALACLVLAAAPGHAQTPAPPPATTAPATQAPPPAIQPPSIEPKAMDILKTACAALAGARAMSFDALSTYEKAAKNGQPLYYASLSKVTLQRPDKLRVITLGDGTPDEFYYDGKTIAAYVPSLDFVAVADAPPTVDQMLDAVWDIAAIDFPFSDVIVSKPCAVFQKPGARSAFYVGQSHVIGGTVTDIVAVANDQAQAELWIGARDHLPRMIRVTYPQEPAHAHYQTDFTNWHLADHVDPASFHSAKAAHARKMPFAPPGTATPPGKPAPATTTKP